MMQTIPISLQANGAVSKNPKGINESGERVGDFTSAFAAAAARRNTEGSSQGVSKGKNGGKVDCRGECESPKDQDPLVQSESTEAERSDKEVRDFKEETLVAASLPSETALPESEKADELLQDHAEETITTTPLLIQEDLHPAAAPNLMMEHLNGERVVQDISVSESLKSEIHPNGNPRIPLDFNSQNPIMSKENHIHTRFPLTEGKQDLKILSTQTDPEKKVGPNFGSLSVKWPVNEAEPKLADVKSTLKIDGEKNVNGESVEISHAKKGNETFNNATVKASQSGANADVAKEKETLNLSRKLDSPWTGPLKKSGKTILSSKRSSISTIATTKNMPAVGREGNDTGFVPRRERKADAALGRDEPAIKQNMKINAIAGNRMNAGDSGFISKNNTSFSDLRPAMESIPGELKIVEKSNQNQKDSSLKSNESFGRLVNVLETEAQPTKAGSDNREGQGDAEKQNRFQGKDFHGMLEKLEVSKGEDVPFVSKARYGSNNGATPVTQITEKEIQNSPTGKENLGSLVRTTAFLLKNGRQEARMALHPESLGHLKIRISTENHQVTVKVMAETVAAKELIEHNLPQLKADFQNQGLEITKFDVSLSQDSDRNGAGQNPSFASNRTKDKTGPKKEENPRQGEKSEQTDSNVNRARHNDAVDFFA